MHERYFFFFLFFLFFSKNERFPIKGRISTIDQKISVLIQCALGSVEFTEVKTSQAMVNETNVIFSHSNRINRCIVETCLERKDSVSLRNALEL